MKYIFLLIFSLLSNFCFASQVLVVVDGVAITSIDVEKRIEALKLISPTIQNNEAAQKQALNALINEELFRNEAHRLKLNATPDEVNEYFQNIKAERHLSDAQMKVIKNNKSVMDQVESQVLWEKLIHGVFAHKVKVSDAEIRDEQKINTEEVTEVTLKQIIFDAYNIDKIANLNAKNCEELDQASINLGLGKPYKNHLPIKDLNPDLQQLVKSMPENRLSEIMDLGGPKQVIMVCNKTKISIKRNIKDISTELSNRKMNAEVLKYIAELKKRICIEYHIDKP